MAHSRKYVLGLGLAVATFAFVVANAIGNVALVTKVGPTPVFSLVAIILAGAAFIVSRKERSFLVAGLLAISGIIFMVPALSAMGYSLNVIVFPGPILGVVFGLVIFGLGAANAIRTARTALTAVPK